VNPRRLDALRWATHGALAWCLTLTIFYAWRQHAAWTAFYTGLTLAAYAMNVRGHYHRGRADAHQAVAHRTIERVIAHDSPRWN
jgi:hypothetical protein